MNKYEKTLSNHKKICKINHGEHDLLPWMAPLAFNMDIFDESEDILCKCVEFRLQMQLDYSCQIGFLVPGS